MTGNICTRSPICSRLTEDRGYYFIDCIYVTPAPPPAPHNITKFTVAPNPLPATSALYNLLRGKYGSGDIFSGQEGPAALAWIEANVGKTPAILGVDMIDYSPTRVVC
jgi:mannan endo-1,4-beta-mannosidase